MRENELGIGEKVKVGMYLEGLLRPLGFIKPFVEKKLVGKRRILW